MKKDAKPANPDQVFDALEEARKSGALTEMVSGSDVNYQSSKEHPGLLERLNDDGTVTLGKFKGGQFIEEPDS
ncbi:MAG: hypothetical protein OQK12_07070 [Motiliproteus sp.]|nr:hypothetical protein [Motiliproteus sp.]MCW9052340.1 hypothetical protein [Motiliproteus sp.]